MDRNLVDIFTVPPLTVLDVKQTYWKTRKKYWLAKIHDSSIGRSNDLLKFSKLMQKKHLPTSKFDPVLTEILVSWFTAPSDVIYDPFSGGSIRGEISSELGRTYIGVDVRPEQVEVNNSLSIKNATWICQSSVDYVQPGSADYVFSCPPYLWLEKYSDNPADLSTMDEESFYQSYEIIIKNSLETLKNDRFASFVVSNVRRKTGGYSNMVGKTIEYFEKHGAMFYNDMVLLQEPASAAMRAFNFMNRSRIVARNHQNVLVFVKGNPKKATERLPKFEDTRFATDTKLSELFEIS